MWDLLSLELDIRPVSVAWWTNDCTVHNYIPLWHVNLVKSRIMLIGSGPATLHTVSKMEISRTCAIALARLGAGGSGVGRQWGPGEVALSFGEGGLSRGRGSPSFETTAVQNQNQNSKKRREQTLQNDYLINIILILSFFDLFNGYWIVRGRLERQSGC
jgi:hypothetical protein